MSLGLATRATAPTSSDTPFIGRSVELDWLRERVAGLHRGQPQVILIIGEPGIGKTRLVTQARTLFARDAIAVHYTRCHEDVTRPYAAFLDTPLASFREAADASQADASDDGRGLSRVFRQAAAENANDGPRTEQHRQQLFGAVSRALFQMAQTAPTVLILDDLHWADTSSLNLFAHLVLALAEAAQEGPLPLALIAVSRPVDAGTTAAFVLADVQRESLCHTRTLGGLAKAEMAQLIQALQAARPSSDLLATFADTTQGNPLFIQEVIRNLDTCGALEELGGELTTTRAMPDLRFPEHLSGAIAARIGGLSEPCRLTLTLASFFAGPVGMDALAHLTGTGPDRLCEVIEEACEVGLLRTAGSRVEFAHPLIKHAFTQQANTTDRQQIHLQIAEYLEGLPIGDDSSHAFSLAHHCIAAGPAIATSKSATHAQRAGERAYALCAWGEAARYYAAASDAAELCGAFPPVVRAEMHLRAAYAAHRDRNPDFCLRYYDRAVQLYRSLGDKRGVAQTLLDKTRAHFELVPLAMGSLADIQPLEEALNALGGEEPALRGRIIETMAEAYWTAQQPDKARPLAESALRIASETGDASLSAYAHLGLALAEMQGLDLSSALGSYDDALRMSRRAEDLWLEAEVHPRRAMILSWTGRLADAAIALEDARASIKRTQDQPAAALAAGVRVALSVTTGDFERAEREAGDAMATARRASYPWGALLFLPSLAAARALRGEWDEAADAISALSEPGRLFLDPGAPIQFVGWMYKQLLDVQAGRLAPEQILGFAQTIATVIEAREVDVATLACFAVLAESADILDDSRLAEIAYRGLLHAAERGAVFVNGWPFLIQRLCATTAAVCHHREQSERHLQDAIESSAAAGALPELVRSLLIGARIDAERGSVHSGVERFERAVTILRQLYAPALNAQANHVASLLQLPPLAEPAGRLSPSEHLTRRELDLALRIARGLKAPAIADELILSQATVDGLLERLQAKLGVHDLDALAAYVHETRLVESLQEMARPQERAYYPLPAAQPVTILFTDMEDYTPLIDTLGDVRAHAVLRTHNRIIRDCLAEHGGVEIKHTGDGVNAWFKSSTAALAGAVAIQQGFTAHNDSNPKHTIRVRIGINAGNPLSEDGQFYGASVNAAARICAHARGGQILVSDIVRQLASGKGFHFVAVGETTLKGFTRPFQLYEVEYVG